MKYKELVQSLQKAGWTVIHGANHDLAVHPQKPGMRIPIPRHKEINEYTARGILEDAGIERNR